MKRKSIWLVLGLLIASLTFALAACGGGEESKYSLNVTAVTLKVGETKQLNVMPAPEGEVAWATDNAAVATVESGLVTAVAKGEAKITATVEGEKTPLTCTVTVEEAQAGGGYTLDVTSVALKTGETKQLTVKDKNGAPVAGATFTSENPAVATVSATGLVKAVAVGETNVKATIGGDTLTCAVTVEQGYTYSLNKTALDIAVGGSDTIALITTPAAPANARPHTFTSGNTAIATVDSTTGRVTGVAQGNTTITCSVDGEELEATVKVTKYTVKVDGTEMGDTIEMRVGGETKTVTVEAEPSRTDITPTFTSGSDAVFTVTTGGVLEAVGAGTATLTVSVGGRNFTANVTVAAAVQYTLKADETPIEEGDTLTFNLEDTKTLTVERNPEGEITFEVDIAGTDGVVTESGKILTGAKIGTATVTVTITDENVTDEGPITITFTVNVVLESSIAHKDIVRWTESVNLQYLDENQTIDWVKYAPKADEENVRMAENTDLIGTLTLPDVNPEEPFYDYKAPIFFQNAQEKGGINTYGKAIHGTYSITIKLTNAVSKVVIFTGAWKETATIEFKLGDIVLQQSVITTQGEDAVSRMITFSVDTSKITEETLTIVANCNRVNGGNVSLAALAVIGTESHNITLTAEATGEVTRELAGAQNITEAGNLDWVAANGTRKAGVPANTVIKGIQYDPSENSGNDFGKNENKGAYITWTDGTAEASNNFTGFKHADNSITATVALTKGKFTVSLYVTGWNCGYLVAVYDKNNNFINAYQAADEWKDNSHTAKVAVTLNVKEAGDYTFKIMKCRGSGNHGWAAIAVSQNSEYSLEKNTFDLTLGGTSGQKIVVKKDGANYTEGVSFRSNDSQIVSVDSSDGTLTANQKGTATVTVTIGEEEFLVFVTVTEYTLTSDTEITLSKDNTSQIEIEADPDCDFTVEYKVTDGDAYVGVDEYGVITAKEKGVATVTATVDGKVFTINVTVVEYKLDQTEITLTLGGEPATATLKMTEGDEDSDVSGVEFTSRDEKIASVVKETGVITAVGFGQTIIEAKKDGTVLECTVIVKLKVETSEKDYLDGSNETVNLDELDDTNVTLDWHFFRDDTVHKMAGGDLIGNLDKARSSGFGDYRTHITWYNGDDTEKASVFGYTDGITFNGGDNATVSFTVKVTQDVTKIVIFTGAWHAKNTVTISYNGVEYAKFEFVNESDNGAANKNKQVIFTPDMENFGTEEKTFTITMSCSENDSGNKDNISLVAIAVIGKTPRGEHTQATASQTHELTANGEAVDLTAVGTLDWAYICDFTNGLVTKNVESHVIGHINCIGGQGDGHDNFANQSFKWSDSAKTPYDGETTDRFKWCDNVQAICVTLKQSAKVTLWISAWMGSIDLTVYDRCTEILTKTRVIDGDGNNSKGVKVEVTLTVTEESTFTFYIKKEGGGNFGLAAIAVANAD